MMRFSLLQGLLLLVVFTCCTLGLNFAPLITTPDITFIMPVTPGTPNIAKIVGDLNGDDIDDVIITQYYGASAWLVFGSPSWTRNSTFDVSSDLALVWGKLGNTALVGDYSGASMLITNTVFNNITSYDTVANPNSYTFYFYDGNADIFLASAGDVNQDGYDDIIAAHTGTDTESVTLIQGSPALSTGYVITARNAAGPEVIWTPELIGYSAGVGDVNDDGYPDFVITAPYTNVNSPGQAYLLYGSPTAFADLDGNDLTTQTANGVLLTGFTYAANLGSYVEALGDISGDGIDDFIITAPADGVGSNEGKAFLIYGSSSYFDKTTFKTLDLQNDPWQGATFSASEIGDSFGSILYAFDVNEDGYLDLLFGAPGAQGGKGRIYLLYGTSTPWSGDIDVNTYPTLTIFEGDTSSTKLGFDIGVGDVNQDGAIDIIAGPATSNAYLYLGTPPSPTNSASVTPSPAASKSRSPAVTTTPSHSVEIPSSPPPSSQAVYPRFAFVRMGIC